MNMTCSHFLYSLLYSFIVQVIHPQIVTTNILIFFLLFSCAYFNLAVILYACVFVCVYNFECRAFRNPTEAMFPGINTAKFMQKQYLPFIEHQIICRVSALCVSYTLLLNLTPILYIFILSISYG